MAKRTRLEIPVAPDYVSWGIWECVRELIQNTVDADSRGYQMEIKYDASTSVLKLRNIGSTITRDKLRLGGTDKKDDPDQRGKFGEGMKLAWMRLIKSDYQLWIRVGDERWIPSIGQSKNFGDAEVLFIDTAPVKDCNDVYIEIRGLSEEDWKIVQDRMLFLRKPSADSVIETSHGRLLMDEQHIGNLYSKGIYVCTLQGNWKYGYDLYRVKLDRDRNIPEGWSLNFHIRELLKYATMTGKMKVDKVMDLLNSDSKDGETLGSVEYDSDAENFAAKITKQFKELHGYNAVPVTGISEAMIVEQNGLKPVIVRGSMKAVIEKTEGPLSKRINEAASSVKRIVQLYELSINDRNLIGIISDEIKKVEPAWDGNICMVEYVGDSLCGTYCNGEVRIAERLLSDPVEFIATAIHEVAHMYGTDGSSEHRLGIERIAAKIIAKKFNLL